MNKILLTSAALAAISGSLPAALIVDQTFDSLVGWTDTSGGNWSVGSDVSYAGWGSSGGSAAELTGGTGQYLTNAAILGSNSINEGTTYWGGLVIDIVSPFTAGRTFGFYETSGNAFRFVLTADGSNNLNVGTRDGGGDPTDGNRTTGSATAMGTGVNLLLFRFDAQAGNDNMYAWWNPDLSLGEPTTASASWSSVGIDDFATTSNLEGFRLNSSNGAEVRFDELRLGDSFTAVVPEPSTYALLAGFSTLVLILRRRRRN